VRAAVRDALRDDPTLLERFPNLRRRAPAEVRELVVVDPDETAAAKTGAEALAEAGVDLATLRVRRVITRMRTQVHLLRNHDGSITSVSSQQPDIRVEWEPVGDSPAVRAAVPTLVDQPSYEDMQTPVDGLRCVRPAAAVGLLIVLLVLAAALFQVTEAPVAPGAAPGIATSGDRRLSPP